MAAPGGKFFIQDNIKAIAPHHESFRQLWETKWKFPAGMGVYPFMFGCAKDFVGIVDEMERRGIKEPYDWEKYAEVFFPKAEELEKIALDAEEKGNKPKAAEYYHRSSVVYRMARFPAPRTPKQKEAWGKSKETVQKALILKGEVGGYAPIHEVLVPHKHGLEHEGKDIPIYHQVPTGASKESPVPCMIIVTGLDGYRTELAVWAEGWRQKNVAFVCIEIPGTGDSPADPKDPTSPDRLFSSLVDWLAQQEAIDQKKMIVWGFSTGGYYTTRLAHTHPDSFAGLISLGGGCHHMFDPAWLNEVNHLEYPFDLANTLCYKFGYGDDVETFKKEALDRFSLLKDGTLDKPKCGRLLLVNGTEDEIFPIDDCFVALNHGAPKEARFIPGIKHMGEPESFFVIFRWIYNILGIEAQPGPQLALNLFKSQFP